MNSTNQRIADAMVRHRLWLLRYERGLVREVTDAYQAYVGDLLKEISAIDRRLRAGEKPTRADRIRLRSLREALAGARFTVANEITGAMTDGLREAFESESRAVARSVEVALPADVRGAGVRVSRVPDEDALVALTEPMGGKVWSHRIADDLRQVQEQVSATLAQAVIEGASVQRTRRMLRSATGLVETYKGRLATIARTEVQRVANTAALESYRRNADVVAGVQWLATLDSRTCPICAPLHNTEWKLYEGVPDLPAGVRAPPAHPNCRCFLAPITKSAEELGIVGLSDSSRQRMDGKAAAGTDFGSWLRRQPADVQREVLGDARLKLWRGNRLKLEQFSDRGRLLTLGQLRARYPDKVPAGTR